MKIPTELPNFFDYYAEKSLSNNRHKNHRGSVSSVGELHKKKSQVETAKKIFNMVKGTNSNHRKIEAFETHKNV